jgi:hypothetical protein
MLLGLSWLLGRLNNGGFEHRVTGLFATIFREHGQTYGRDDRNDNDRSDEL